MGWRAGAAGMGPAAINEPEAAPLSAPPSFLASETPSTWDAGSGRVGWNGARHGGSPMAGRE